MVSHILCDKLFMLFSKKKYYSEYGIFAKRGYQTVDENAIGKGKGSPATKALPPPPRA